MGVYLSFRLPSLLLKLRCDTPRRLYSLAWTLSDDRGIFTLDPATFSSFPATTRRRWAKRLVSWHLWELVDPGRGRGKHPVYCIRGKSKFVAKQAHRSKIIHEAKGKELKPPLQANAPKASEKTSTISKASPWKQDAAKRRVWLFEGWFVLEKDRYGWGRCAQAFRLGLKDFGFSNEWARKLAGVIMNGLEHKSVEECQRVYRELGAWLVRQWGVIRKLAKQGLKRLYSWLGWALSRFLKDQVPEELKTKREKLLEIQEQLRQKQGHGQHCECHECDKEHVRRKREAYDRAYGIISSPDGRRTWTNWAEWALNWQHHDLMCRCNFCRGARVRSVKK
ncbi:hypothetical protein HYR54_15540 [Candidatus Acetothermia bacterium]|nr:hypothetical protein [Candidatus Acetothermia bacterium]